MSPATPAIRALLHTVGLAVLLWHAAPAHLTPLLAGEATGAPPPASGGLVFGERESNLHGMTCGAGKIWCGLATGNKLVKVNPATMTYETVVLKGQGGLHDLCFDGTDVWGVHSSGHTTRRVEEGHLMPDHVHMLLSVPPKYRWPT